MDGNNKQTLNMLMDLILLRKLPCDGTLKHNITCDISNFKIFFSWTAQNMLYSSHVYP